MEAKEFLRQVKKADLKIKNKLIEKQQWHDLSVSITSVMGGERVQSSGNPSKMADAVIVATDMEAMILKEVIRLRDVKTKVVETIEKLDSPTEYDVLHRRYIQYQSLQDVADHYHKDYGWATTVHGRALKHVQELME